MTRLGILISLAALAGWNPPVQESVSLRRTIVPNATEAYRVRKTESITTTLPNNGGQQDSSVTSLATFELRFGAVDPKTGVASITTTTTFLKLDSPELGASGVGAQLPKPVIIPGTMDSLGKLILEGKKASGGLDQFSAQAGTVISPLLVVFPDHEVKLGDSWNIVVPKGPFTGKDDQTLTATLSGAKNINGKDAWEIDVSGQINMGSQLTIPRQSQDGAQNPLAGKRADLSGSLNITGSGFVDKQTCQLLRIETKVKSKQTVNIVDLGFSIDTTSTATTTAELLLPS